MEDFILEITGAISDTQELERGEGGGARARGARGEGGGAMDRSLQIRRGEKNVKVNRTLYKLSPRTSIEKYHVLRSSAWSSWIPVRGSRWRLGWGLPTGKKKSEWGETHQPLSWRDRPVRSEFPAAPSSAFANRRQTWSAECCGVWGVGCGVRVWGEDGRAGRVLGLCLGLCLGKGKGTVQHGVTLWRVEVCGDRRPVNVLG